MRDDGGHGLRRGARARPGDVAAVVGTLTAALSADGPHRPPRPTDGPRIDTLVAAVLAALGGAPRVPDDPAGPDLESVAHALGFATRVVGGRTVLVADPGAARSWGLVALPAKPGPPEVLVEVPHPRSDLRTEEIGVGVDARLGRSLLLVAGAHRGAGSAPGASGRRDFPADVSHRPDSVLARVAAGVVAARRTPQVQIHGCADREGFDVVASSGAAAGSPLLDAVVVGLRSAGERVRRGGEPGCEDLSGTRNVQGRVAARYGAPFVHLELARSLRRDAVRREGVVAAVTDAVVATRDG